MIEQAVVTLYESREEEDPPDFSTDWSPSFGCLLTCRLAQVENMQAVSTGLMGLPCREGAGLEMMG